MSLTGQNAFASFYNQFNVYPENWPKKGISYGLGNGLGVNSKTLEDFIQSESKHLTDQQPISINLFPNSPASSLLFLLDCLAKAGVTSVEILDTSKEAPFAVKLAIGERKPKTDATDKPPDNALPRSPVSRSR